MDNNNPFFFVSPFNFDEIQGSSGSYGPASISNNSQFDELEVLIKSKKDHFFNMDDMGAYCHDDPFGFYQHNMAEKGVQMADLSEDQQKSQEEPKSDYSIFDDFNTNFTTFSPTQPIEESSTTTFDHHDHDNIVQACINQMPSSTSQSTTPFASLELISSKLNTSTKNMITSNAKGSSSSSSSQISYPTRRQKLSTEEIIWIAGSRYIQFSNHQVTNDVAQYMSMHPFGYALSGLSQGETEDVELVHLLLSAAEKVGYQQYERATKLLQSYQLVAFPKANPVERVVSIFVEALREKIDKETGISRRRTSTISTQEGNIMEIANGLSTNIISLTCHQQLPFLQILQFPAVQAILESFESETKLHIIDLQIRSGIQWTGLMQALAGRNDQDRPVELLKITAIGSTKDQNKIEETKNRLMSLAESLNLPFSFKPLILSDIEYINETLFETEENETLAVYSSLLLRTMMSRPRCLEKLMRVITNLKPSIMVVVEVEANLNSPSFANRFVEALFFYGAFFDCLDSCIKQVDFRTIMEEVLALGIRNIVTKENSERLTRSVRIGVWRAFFERYRMVEIKLSDSSLYQANLVAKQFGYGSSLSLDKNGRCLMVEWKGTPIHSLSTWKFL